MSDFSALKRRDDTLKAYRSQIQMGQVQLTHDRPKNLKGKKSKVFQGGTRFLSIISEIGSQWRKVFFLLFAMESVGFDNIRSMPTEYTVYRDLFIVSELTTIKK